ncbi:MAG TPA: helix-turn-helix transcriptional regulator [Candidatus Rifleibacterium sp.]|nr:helix-turn-helix transcriptional regulator [Candidatus Rifleibacterium sp.]
MTSNRISVTVKERRKALGITQQELAQKAGVGLRFIRDLGEGKPTVQLAKVNQVLFMFGLELGAVPIDRERLLNEKG